MKTLLARRYTVGYMFSEDLRHVLLVEKEKPAAQKGKLNGIGGKVETIDCEGPEQLFHRCVAREFEEETGVHTAPMEWVQFGVMKGSDWDCALLTCVSNQIWLSESPTSERIHRVHTDHVLGSFPPARMPLMGETLKIFQYDEHGGARRWMELLPNVPAHVALALLRLGQPDWFLGAVLEHGVDMGR